MNINDTILRQYGNSPKLKNLIYLFNNAINVEQQINDFYDKIFNVKTATALGLEIWGTIVDVSGYVKFEELGEVFGFKGQNLQTFNYGTFYSGKKISSNLKLSREFFRAVIMAKAAVNISNTTISDINRILAIIFPNDVKPFVTDNRDMTMHYVFPFYLKPNEVALIKNSGVLPRPSGVQLRGLITVPKKTFGFWGTGFQSFNHGTFIGPRGIIDVS